MGYNFVKNVDFFLKNIPPYQGEGEVYFQSNKGEVNKLNNVLQKENEALRKENEELSSLLEGHLHENAKLV